MPEKEPLCAKNGWRIRLTGGKVKIIFSLEDGSYQHVVLPAEEFETFLAHLTSKTPQYFGNSPSENL
jgi:hypothetical protein